MKCTSRLLFGLMLPIMMVGLMIGVSLKPAPMLLQPRLLATVIQVDGTRAPGGPPSAAGDYKSELNGYLDTPDNPVWVVTNYPASFNPLTGIDQPTLGDSINLGVTSLDSQIKSTSGPKIAFCYSQGAAVCGLEKRNLQTDPSAPPADQLMWVSIGDPLRPNGGLFARFPGLYIPILNVTFYGAGPDTQYKTINVGRQYDTFSDFPVDPLNALAVINALLGGANIHPDYSHVDINTPTTTKQVVGNTTYYTAYTDKLPLLQPFRDLAAMFGRTQTPLLDAIEPALRVLIETGYDRTNYGAPTAAQPGSSLLRLPAAIPQLVSAVQQGVESLAKGNSAPAPAVMAAPVAPHDNSNTVEDSQPVTRHSGESTVATTDSIASSSEDASPQEDKPVAKNASSEESGSQSKDVPDTKKPLVKVVQSQTNPGNKFEPGDTVSSNSTTDAKSKGSDKPSTSGSETTNDNSASSGSSKGSSSGSSGSSAGNDSSSSSGAAA